MIYRLSELLGYLAHMFFPWVVERIVERSHYFFLLSCIKITSPTYTIYKITRPILRFITRHCGKDYVSVTKMTTSNVHFLVL